MADAKPLIVLAERFSPSAVARLRTGGRVIELDRPDPDRLAEALADADALLVRTYTQVTADLIAAAPRLRVIGRGGVGLENIDLPAARRHGIVVVHTPAAATRSVAEHTVALMLAVERKLIPGDGIVRGPAHGHAPSQVYEAESFIAYRSNVRYRELGELTLGVVGMGRIGSAVGGICARGFSMRVLHNDIVDVGPFDFPVEAVAKDRLYDQADIITLHVPLTDQTRGMIGAVELKRCGASATLINTARGAIVDSRALANALASGGLAGAGLDVFEPEPLPPAHPLRSAPNLVMTPHVAARSSAGLERMNDVVDDVLTVLRGGSPQYPACDEGPC